MPETDGLITFLNARLDEDEAAAESAAKPSGQFQAPGRSAAAEWEQTHVVYPDGDDEWRAEVDSAAGKVVFAEGAPSMAQAAHIARHDPARVLREVEVKRKLIKEFADRSTRGVAEIYLATLAAVYSGHPDYRDEWSA